jgi:hypothetical protein
VKRPELEHIIRAASAITGATEIVVIGSQAILGQFPQAPAELLKSMEADVFSFRDPADSDLIDGSIGEASPFHQTFGYYAHGVAEETAQLPDGWKDRLVRIQNENTGTGTALCLEVHDLAVAKLFAGREKDVDFIVALLKHRLINRDVIRQRLAMTQAPPEKCDMTLARWQRLSTSQP